VSDLATDLGIPIAAYRIGPGGDIADLYGDFARLGEIGEDGCLLVRPDQHVGWRSAGGDPDAVAGLRGILERLLGRVAIA
jgi:2,4-dichlorophenol 6-monooxygenase